MPRASKPDFVIEYEKGPPKCCHTCAKYDEAGECSEFEMSPPDEYTCERDVCDAWLFEVPF